MMQHMRIIDADTDRLIVAYYRNGSGGKFLLNCLALSRHMVLQDSMLAQKQLTGYLDPKEKLKILLARLQQVTHRWNDLDLGCVQLFGTDQFKNPQVSGFKLNHCKFHPIVHELSHGAEYFACVAHNVFELAFTLERWNQASVIRLVNANRFMDRFRPNDRVIKWQDIRGPDWPGQPPTDLDQYLAMPEFVQQEIRDFELETYFTTSLLWAQDQDWLTEQEELYYQSAVDGRRCWVWDVDWYLDLDTMLHQLADLYAWLHLDDLDTEMISTYYDAYFSALQRVRQHR